MTKKAVFFYVFLAFICFTGNMAIAKTIKFIPFSKDYSHTLCKQKGFACLFMKRSVSWKKIWPDSHEREIIMKINRVNRQMLIGGMTIAVPDSLRGKTLMDFSPFPRKAESLGEKFVVFDPALLGWAAYSSQGDLVGWGPALGGRDYCPDIKRACRTPVGDNFRVTYKGNYKSHSPVYPLGCHGNTCAPMPYVMYFLKLFYGIHGSTQMIGWNASHGCVRTFIDDAEWLNKNFVEIGTMVIVKPYPYPLKKWKSKK